VTNIATTPAPYVVYLIIKYSACSSSKVEKPWRQLADVGPQGLPSEFREAKINHCYRTISAPRLLRRSREQWNVKVEYVNTNLEPLRIMGYATSRENALKHLETASLADMARHEKRTNFKIQPKYTYNGALAFKACEYKVLENSEAQWF
jgi:hypothetical protein